MRGRAIVLVIAATMVAACDVTGLLGPTGGVYPGACDSFGFGERQCAAIVAKAEGSAGLSDQTMDSIDLLPPTSDGGVRLGGRMIARVRFHRATEPDRTEEVWCIGVFADGDRVCNPDASIGIAGGVDHDVPCASEAPDSCATLPPTARPAIQAMASPLHVATLDIPIDHVGHYEIDVGRAGLPDGVLSARSATLADVRPTTFWIEDGIVLDVRPLDPNRPAVGSVYRAPFDGVEPVTVFLVFDVTEVAPGGVLEVRDLTVG